MDHAHLTHKAEGSFKYIPGGTVGFCVEDDTESCYEFEFQTSKLCPLPSVPGESPADKLFINGRIVALEKLNDCDSSPECCEDDDQLENLEGEKNKVVSSSPTDVQISSSEQKVSSRIERDQKLIDARKSFFFDSTVLNGFVKLKKLMKHRPRKVRQKGLTFSSEANSHNTKLKQETTTVAASRRSYFYRKSWTSFFNWLFLRSDSKYNNYDINGENKQMKPRIVEINGQGPMKEVLDVLTAGRLSTDSRNVLAFESGSRPSSAPASPSHWNCDNRYEERESSIISAISFCKRSCGNQGEK